MSDLASLQAENAELRQQIEVYRQRELTGLQEQLAAATADVAHYRAEAERNAQLGHQIHNEAQKEVERLRERVSTLERLSSVRGRAS